jgi:quercetin dioxygenase-like cupin family protein
VPANGHADPVLMPANTGLETLSMGYQTIAPRSRVREHSHGDQVELQICFRGQGRVLVDGVSHPLVPGTACFLGHDVKHEILNESDEDLVMLWVITPPGLEHFFKAIGRPREAGAPAPQPFARPADVVAIERQLGMNDTRA